MPEPEPTITTCDSCGNAMDVSAVAPFSKVECPTCGESCRVKKDFGHYTLTRRLAEGGMSLVFVAMDNTLGREVALKILNEDYSADERRIAAFEEEARITASFSHPHVVRVFTTGRAFGRFYIAMELVPGGHFEHQIRERGIIPEVEILPFAVEVAEGLEAARAAGLIHRDIKPGNILLDSQGAAKIVDFGLALLTKDGSATAQEIWATPYYVPPETIEGHPEDFRSDLYAFGATLYHALAGKPPCDEQSMATDKLRLAKRNVKPLRSAAPDISDDTCAIVDKAMAYDRNARYSSYEEMISQLKSSLARLKKGKSGNATARRAAARKKEIIAIGAAAVLVLAAIGGSVAWVLRPEPVEPQPESIAIEAPEITDEPGTATLIGQRYREARDAVEAGDYEKARTAFVALREDPEVQEPTRTWAAVEAVVVTFLDGQTTEAKKEAKAAADHIRTTDLAEKKTGERLLSALGKVGELEPVKRGDPTATGNDAAWALAIMLGGLKNWEQGLVPSAAKEFFEPLAAADFKPHDQWVKAYQKIARIYLHDQQLLSDPVFTAIPADKAACQAAIDRCEKLLPQVKTKGRARFNIRAFQLDLKRQITLLDRPQVPAAPPLASGQPGVTPPATTDGKGISFFPTSPETAATEALAKFEELTKACRFEEASEFLKSLTAEPAGATRESLLSLTASAISFLAFLEEDISRSATPVQLRLRNGFALQQVKVPKPGHLTAIATNGLGGQGEYGWGDIDPESVILLYRTSARTRVAEIDKLQRHETAIAYDWLVGDRARAKAAADRLSLDSDLFKRRWEALASGLPRS